MARRAGTQERDPGPLLLLLLMMLLRELGRTRGAGQRRPGQKKEGDGTDSK